MAKGINPVTNKAFPASNPLNQVDVTRELYEMARLETKEKSTAKPKPSNHGSSWSEDEKAEVSELFADGAAISDLAQHLERSKGAIRAELKRQGIELA